MPKKILLTTPTFPPINSGLGNVVQQLAKRIGDQGWEVIIATGGSTRSQYRDTSSGALIEQFNISGADSIAQSLRGDVDSYVSYLKDSQFDVILMNAWQIWSTDLVLSHYAEIHGKKLLYSHCISTNSIIGKPTLRSIIRYLAWRPYWWTMPKKMCQLDGIIFLASKGCDARFDDVELAKQLGIKPIVMPNILSEQSFSRLKTGPSNLLERDGILSIGAYDWQKGHDFVLRAYANSSLKNTVKLDICGQQFSPFTQELKDLASYLGLDSHYIHFHEGLNQNELLNKYSKARLFVYGSHTECQPLVLMDAMATGTPYISRASGSIPMMKGGIAVNSEKDAAQAINRLYGDSVEWTLLSAEGQNSAMENHNPNKVIKILLDTFRKHTEQEI